MRALSIMRIAAASVALTVTLGCAVVWTGADQDGTSRSGGGRTRTAGPVPTDEANQVVTKALDDVERFWTATYPGLSGGKPFQAVQGGYHPYTRSDPPPGCGEEAGEYQPNAFYCPVGDFIAWDAETLVPQLNADFGPLLVGVVIAHEYGHAIQTRLGGGDEPTVVLEQQADCFAGAWVGDLVAGGSTAFGTVDPNALDSTVAGLLTLRDQPGTSAENPQAHGNAFDRVRAFQEGVEESAKQCATYRNGNIPVTEVPFSTQQEAATGGDLPYDQAVNALGQDADEYWQRTFPQLTGQQWQSVRLVPFAPGSPPDCPARSTSSGPTTDAAFFCADGSFVAFDNVQLAPQLYQRIGDNAVGMLLGDLYAQAVQQRRGRSTQDRPGQLAVDCLAGSWTNDLLNRDVTAPIRLSPGDLDEAVTALLAFGRAAPNSGGSAFERIAAFRNGVLEGLSACG